MTKNEGSVVDRVRGYIDAKKEARRDQVFSDRMIMALDMAYTILEKEIYSLGADVKQAHEWNVKESKVTDAERKKNFELMKLNQILANKLREKTYPIDREYKLKKERDEYREIADLRYACIKPLKEELNRANDKIGLQQIEIGHLGGLLKEADEKLNEANIKIEDLQSIIEGLHVEAGLNLEKITELKQTLERVRMEVVEQTARDNEKKLKGAKNGKK